MNGNGKILVLDLYCGAGGASMGYYRAFGPGVQIVGVDIEPQPRYPFEFVQADALEYVAEHGGAFNLIHASPPCQRFSVATPEPYKAQHPDLIVPTRRALRKTGRPYVIENVEGARRHLRCPVKLCGTMFGLNLRRHRYFEVHPLFLMLAPPCNHSVDVVYVTGSTGHSGCGFHRRDFPKAEKESAMEIDWMITDELDEAIPPVYTEWIANRLIEFGIFGK